MSQSPLSRVINSNSAQAWELQAVGYKSQSPLNRVIGSNC